MRNRTGILSITFDDVPRSACLAGRSILERHGCAGTYFVCGGLTATTVGGHAMHTLDDLRSLVGAGHEIGSHGYGHLNYQTVTSEQVDLDLRANREYLEQVALDPVVVSFAYPFGCVSPRVKALVGTRFASARGVVGGPQFGHVDAALLKAQALYEATFDAGAMTETMAGVAAGAGWLVLLTHDVGSDPSATGCRPETLEFALRAAQNAGLTVLPIKHALGRVAFRPEG